VEVRNSDRESRDGVEVQEMIKFERSNPHFGIENSLRETHGVIPKRNMLNTTALS